MDREKLKELTSIDPEIRRDAERILFVLEQMPDGYNTTTHFEANESLGRPGRIDESYLFDLHAALMLLSEIHGLKLDMSRHLYRLEGLPYNLDYDVWHRKDAATNRMFDDESSPENRDWCDRHDEIIANSIAGILSKALPAFLVPSKLRFDHENAPALDAETIKVYCGFKIDELTFFLLFELNTGWGSLRSCLKSEPTPSVEGVTLTCEGVHDGFAAVWDPTTAEWDKSLPLDL